MRNRVVFFGCGGHARSAADILLAAKPSVEIVFVDSNARVNEKILGFDVLHKYEVNDEMVFPASGENIQRLAIIESYNENIISIISPHAYIGINAKIGKGTLVAHNAHVGVESIIGEGVIVNTSASIDHEVTVGRCTHIAPNVTICGRVKIGKNCLVGAGSSVIDKISIVDEVIIGAGSVVVCDILKQGTYVGCPARIIK